METTTEAVYENGLLRPLHPLPLLENEQVTITVTSRRPPIPEDCVGIMPDEDAAEMLQIIEDAFERVDPDEWK